MSASYLFNPLKVGGLTLKNRIAMAAMTRSRAGTSRIANEYIAQHYADRADAGLLITEGTPISEQAYGWYGVPALYTEEQAKGWKKTTDAVHAKGGVIFAQLWHMGRQAHPSFNAKKECVAPSAIQIKGAPIFDADHNPAVYAMPRALETSEIPEIVKDFQKSAALAKKAGFDGVELHGANGYLIDQFLQTTSNKRTDAYGGSLEKRYRFLGEIVDAVSKEFPLERIMVKLSPNGVFGGMGSEDNYETFTHVISELNGQKVGFLDVMDGLGFGFHGKSRPVNLLDVRQRFNGTVLGGVGYNRDTGDGALRTGAVDMIAFGRPFLSNPDLISRYQNGWPLNGDLPHDLWYGWEADPVKCLKGYNDHPRYNPPATNLQ